MVVEVEAEDRSDEVPPDATIEHPARMTASPNFSSTRAIPSTRRSISAGNDATALM